MTPDPPTRAPGPVAHRVAAAALVHRGRVLLCHRRPDLAWYPDVWDLPGGHLHPGETPHDALVRECREELGVHVLDTTPIPVETGDPHVVLHLFAVHSWRGEPVNAAADEHDRIDWFDRHGITALGLADPRYLPLLTDLIAAAHGS